MHCDCIANANSYSMHWNLIAYNTHITGIDSIAHAMQNCEMHWN